MNVSVVDEVRYIGETASDFQSPFTCISTALSQRQRHRKAVAVMPFARMFRVNSKRPPHNFALCLMGHGTHSNIMRNYATFQQSRQPPPNTTLRPPEGVQINEPLIFVESSAVIAFAPVAAHPRTTGPPRPAKATPAINVSAAVHSGHGKQYEPRMGLNPSRHVQCRPGFGSHRLPGPHTWPLRSAWVHRHLPVVLQRRQAGAPSPFCHVGRQMHLWPVSSRC